MPGVRHDTQGGTHSFVVYGMKCKELTYHVQEGTHLFLVYGMTYRKVGSASLDARMAGLECVCSSLQSINSIVSSSKGCDSTSAHTFNATNDAQRVCESLYAQAKKFVYFWPCMSI
eukprot:1160632-Pelagomonas_calceolata.AAC.9